MIFKWIITLLTAVTLASCGGSSSGGGNVAAPAAATTFTLNGVATKGPIKGGTVSITDANKLLVIFSGVTDSNGKYSIAIPANMTPPLTIQVDGGIDQITNLPQDMVLESALTAIPATGSVVANSNVLSTLVVGTARNLGAGGVLNATSLQQAVGNVMTGMQGMGLPVAFNPISDAQNGSNAAEVIRANEAAGEMLRRVKVQTGAVSISSVAQQLSADLTDQVIDGYVDAAATVSSAQLPNATFSNNVHTRIVEVESEVLANTLKLTNLGTGLSSTMNLQRVNALLQASQSPYTTFSSIPTTQEQQNLITQSAKVMNAIQTGSANAPLDPTIAALVNEIQSQIVVGQPVSTTVQQNIDRYSNTTSQNLTTLIQSVPSTIASTAGVTAAQTSANSFKLTTTGFSLTDYYANGSAASYSNLPYSNSAGVLTLDLPTLNGSNANSIVQGTGGTSPVITLALASVPNGSGTIAAEVLLKTDLSNGVAPTSTVNSGETSATVTFSVKWSASGTGNSFSFVSQPGIAINYKKVSSGSTISAVTTDGAKTANLLNGDTATQAIKISLVNVFTSLPNAVSQLGLGSNVSGKYYFYQVKLPGLPLQDGNGQTVSILQGSFAIQ